MKHFYIVVAFVDHFNFLFLNWKFTTSDVPSIHNEERISILQDETPQSFFDDHGLG